ncbi:DUF5994 family protein [Kitasatospora paranensis]|uniref:DUF5994 family protein n=1 Tax=Kitasatospora paranensis TaxID=258053 RepID=A0ABW2G753_9ACTN
MATDRTFPYPITGLFDGARWPRSHEPRSEPPSLIAALRGRVGPILPVSVERTARNTVPHRVTVDGQVVRINRFSSSVHTIGVGDGHQDRFLLLVVPPRTRPAAARTAMASAAAPGNSTLAPWILTAASLGPAAEGAPPTRPAWRNGTANWPPPWPPPWPVPLPPGPQPLPPRPQPGG